MKGIILAGGTGSRLFPITRCVSKQLLPIYDKPMIFYPLTTLMLAGITNILVITSPDDRPLYEKLLGDGTKWGIKLDYQLQPTPAGIAQSFILGADFIGNESCALILGDNIFYGEGLAERLQNSVTGLIGATVFAYFVKNPEEYGVVNFDHEGNVLDIIEKPKIPKSNFAITGLYLYDNKVKEFAKQLSPSNRGELEITDINNLYIAENELCVERLDRGYAWLDSGTPDGLLQASQFVSIIEHRQGLKIACPEEVAFRMNYINVEQLLVLAEEYCGNEYGEYLFKIASDFNKV